MRKRSALPLIFLLAASLACSRQAASQAEWNPATVRSESACSTAGCGGELTPTPVWVLPPTRVPNTPISTPTPDEPKILPTLRTESETYVIQSGDTLGSIASRKRVSLQALLEANELADPNLVSAGQTLVIPAPTAIAAEAHFKIIPDSELIEGPLSTTLALKDFVQQSGGYLAAYTEDVEDAGANLTGTQIVEKVAREYSVNPRLLLALIEYRSGWVTQPQPEESTLHYPIGYYDERHQGLYKQLCWAANNLNLGYYQWRANAAPVWFLADGSMVQVDNTLNAGTAGVQALFAALDPLAEWTVDVSEDGLFATYQTLFGYPFDLTVEPIVPADLEQPELRLPFENGVAWSFTGGPHAAWGSGSAWAALDFAPPGDQVGCYQSDAWVVAMADGQIVRSENGEVVEDLDGDGFEQTGWNLLYMHIESRDRVKTGAVVKAGDRIGHPSCEGGVSDGTHTHLARKYNGEWIPADGLTPFILDGWITTGTENEYDGYLIKNGKSIEAWNGRRPENQIER